MDTHMNMPLMPKGREMIVRAVVDWAVRGRDRRPARPLLEASLLAGPNDAGRLLGDVGEANSAIINRGQMAFPARFGC